MKAKNLKLIAKTDEDLRVISAHLQDSIIKTSDIANLKKNKIFLIYINRIAKEIENSSNKLNSIIRFEYIQASKSKNIDQKKQNQDLELISIDIFKKNNIFEITLLFMDNKIITLTAEIIEVTLEDQKNIND